MLIVNSRWLQLFYRLRATTKKQLINQHSRICRNMRMKETYNYDSCRVVLNRCSLPEPPYPTIEPPGTSVVLGLVTPATTGVATRVGSGTGAGVTRVSLGTRPPVLAIAAVVP